MAEDASTRRREANDELSPHELLGLLRAAIDGDRFAVSAAPIVELATGEPIKHELTLRLPADAGGLVARVEFQSVAQRFGLTGELDALLIRWAAELARNGDAVAIDIQAGSLSDPDLARRTEQALADAGAAPRLVTFELSEDSLTANAPAASAFAHRMHDLGASITGDRFGTGSAGFGYLKRLPLDCLKIDAGFVEKLRSTPSDEQFVRAFVGLAHGLGLAAAADGVLDAATLAVLVGAGVEQAQGAFFGDPVLRTEHRLARPLSPADSAREGR